MESIENDVIKTNKTDVVSVRPPECNFGNTIVGFDPRGKDRPKENIPAGVWPPNVGRGEYPTQALRHRGNTSAPPSFIFAPH